MLAATLGTAFRLSYYTVIGCAFSRISSIAPSSIYAIAGTVPAAAGLNTNVSLNSMVSAI
jgi:hypothetical protein